MNRPGTGSASGSGSGGADGAEMGPPRRARRQGIHDCTHCGRPIAGTSADPVVALKDGWFHYRCMSVENRGKFAREARAARAAEVGEDDSPQAAEGGAPSASEGGAPIREPEPAPAVRGGAEIGSGIGLGSRAAPPAPGGRRLRRRVRKLTPEEIRAAEEEDEEEGPILAEDDPSEVLMRAIEAMTPKLVPTGAFGSLLASMHDFEEVDPAKIEEVDPAKIEEDADD